ncbi:MAG: hypothetical protein BZ138_06890, partial [Methanosphaera sp. rholeuAM270]
GDGFGEHWLSDLVWIHDEWLSDATPLPYDVVHGHSVTTSKNISKMRAADPDAFCGSVGRICSYGKGKYDIDCGCARGGDCALGCLRLDDLEEFYVPSMGN